VKMSMNHKKTRRDRRQADQPTGASRPPFRMNDTSTRRGDLLAADAPPLAAFMPNHGSRQHSYPALPYTDVVTALADALHDHDRTMRDISREPGLADARHNAQRESLKREPAHLTALEKDIEKLEQELNADILQTGPGSSWLEKKGSLRAHLAQCEEAIEAATRALESKTVEINGKHYVAENHIAEMKSRERVLYQKVNARNPYYEFLLEWTIGDYDVRARRRLEKEIARTEKEYADQTAKKEQILATLQSRKRELLKQITDHDSLTQVIDRKRAQVESRLDTRLKDLEVARIAHSQSVATALADIERRQKEVVAETNATLETQRRIGDQQRSVALRAVHDAVHGIFKLQPPLANLHPVDLPWADHHPAEFCLGWFNAQGKPDWQCWFPSTIPFPIQQAVWLAASDDDARKHVQTILFRLMTAMPPNGLTINVIDPQRLGESLGPLRRLLNRPGPFFGREVTTLADKIEAALKEENDRLEELIQVTLGESSNTWRTYNANNPRTPLQYRVVVYFDAPEQLTDTSLVFLQRLVELGPARGILPIVVLGDLAGNERRGSQLQKTMANNAFRLQDVFPSDAGDVQDLFSGVAECKTLPDRLPPRPACAQILDEISIAYGQALNRTPGIEELWSDGDLWNFSATDGLSIPLGWSRDGSPVGLELGRPGGTSVHTLVAGRPGAGKSSLLHVLLHSLCHRYSPAEVRVMLLDYKQGVEMAMYASPMLPHADLVAMDSDVSYGVTVLEYLRDEIERRAKLFQEVKKTSLDQYNRACDNHHRLPRILLLIDEFQVLFAEDRATTTDIEGLLISLLRQGRAYGIHVLLCTQTLSGLTNISLTQLTALIAERICLACDAQDSVKTLSSGNEAGARLSGPPEAILNSSNGSKDANRLFIFPEPVVAACQQHLFALSQKAVDTGFGSSARLFRGDEAITVPPSTFFQSAVGSGTDTLAVVGQALRFEAGPLAMPWPARLGGHVLLTGPSPAIRDGILTALLRSLACRDTPLEVTLYDVRENHRWQSVSADLPSVARFSQLPVDWDGDFADLPALSSGHLGVFVIDGLDQDRLLKSAVLRPRATTPPANPMTTVTEFLESAHKKGWRVIATADNWRRLDTPDRKDLLNEFQIRIGFQMSDDDAARMTFNAARAFGIGGSQDRAIYFDQHTNRFERFRPFVLK